MWRLFIGLFSNVFSFLLRPAVTKFAFASVVFSGFSMLLVLLINLLPESFSGTAVGNAFSTISPEIWYLFDIFKFDYGIPALFSASATVFLIRRVPFFN